eukprot:TRINITY_DN2838_c0_g4_i1.p1 TRINITY_DN2838_c0_g4~~TRINITY_DN2838_c0_g4_i1.p1  ORF type:complete len:172 (-),score=22.89 TRINITY_DN2838_c0_g4_i1:120-635(-)
MSPFFCYTLALVVLASVAGTYSQPLGYYWFPEGYYYQQGPFPGILAIGAAGSVVDFRFTSTSYPGSCVYGESVSPLYYGPTYVIDETLDNFFLSSTLLGGEVSALEQVSLQAQLFHDVYGWKITGTLSIHIEGSTAEQYLGLGGYTESSFTLVINLNLRPLNRLYPLPYIC